MIAEILTHTIAATAGVGGAFGVMTLTRRTYRHGREDGIDALANAIREEATRAAQTTP